MRVARDDFAMNVCPFQDSEDESVVPPVIGRDIVLVGECRFQEKLSE
jgi:hypothetical protein